MRAKCYFIEIFFFCNLMILNVFLKIQPEIKYFGYLLVQLISRHTVDKTRGIQQLLRYILYSRYPGTQ